MDIVRSNAGMFCATADGRAVVVGEDHMISGIH
jgi:hypothetical protein